MEDKHRTILWVYRPNIVNDLEPNDILLHLGSVFTENDDEEIKTQSTRQRRCEKLVEILLRKGPNAFKVFVEALKKVVPHLANVLMEADKGTDKELQEVRKQSANLRRENCELKERLEVEEQDHTKTSQELKELKSLHKTFKTETSQQIRTLAKTVQQLTGTDKELRQENSKLKERLEAEEQDHTKTSQELKELKSLHETFETETSQRIRTFVKTVQRLTAGDSSSSCKALGNWKDSTKSETLTLGKEIEELASTITQMIISYQTKIEAQRKRCQGLQEHEELSKELKAANENQQREIEDLRVKNNESKEMVLRLKNKLEESKRDLEKIKNDLANERDRVKQKSEEARKAADDLLKLRSKNEEQQVCKENKSHRKKPSEERWKCGTWPKGVHRSRVTWKPQMPGGNKDYSKDFDKRGDVSDLTIFGKGPK